MFNLFKNIFLLTVFLSISGMGYCDTQSGLIGEIKGEEGQVSFTLNDVSGEACLLADEAYTFTLDTPIKKYWSAMILAASHTNKRMAVRFDLCSVRGDKRVMYLYQDF